MDLSNAGENEDEDRLVNPWSTIHRDEKAFKCAREGDHLLIPFECDACIFLKLRNQLPDLREAADILLLESIRRMNLDAFWSRESPTVIQNARRARKQIELSRLVGLEGPYSQYGDLPMYDHCGYEVAIGILLYSRQPGKYDKTYTQYDTIRHLRSTYSNFVRASPQSNIEKFALGDFKGNYQRLVNDECGSLFFKRFMEGLKRRMGQDWRPNQGFSTDLLLVLIRKAEEEILSAENEDDKHLWIVFVTYVVVTYVISLRGPEGFLLDIRGLLKYWREENDYVIIALLGKIKGEHHDIAHLIPAVTKTKSGIPIKKVLQRLLKEKQKLGFSNGPAISNIQGKVLNSAIINDMMEGLLTEIFETDKHLFPITITSKSQIRDSYQCFRSFRRSSDTRAIQKKVDTKDIDVVNRWRTVEEAQGRRPSRAMRNHYAQLDQLLDPFLRYTFEM